MFDAALNGQLDLLQKQFDKEYGQGVFCNASIVKDGNKQLLSTTPSLDLALSGGIPEGSWVTLTGAPKTGKSVLSLTMAAAAQAQGRPVFYADVEARLKKKNLDIAGLDLSPDKFRLLRSTPEKILGGADFLNQIVTILETVPRAFCVIDSVSALAERKELSEGVEAETRGNINKRISSFCRVASSCVAVHSSIVVGITHRYSNTSGFGKSELEKAGFGWKHQRDVCIRIKKSEPWTIEDKKSLTGLREIGRYVTWVVEESALGAPGSEVMTYLRYGTGYDKDIEIYELGKGFGLIGKPEGSSWVTMSFMDSKKQQKIQGDEKAYKFLQDNPDVFEKLKGKVYQSLIGQPEAEAS